MDISFKTPQGRFNYRVCGVIVHNNRLLVMQDDACAYSYLPGGRVKMGETAAAAMQREIQEEMNLSLPILRPLWICEGFFTEDTSGERFHEICIYYLLDGATVAEKDFSSMENGRIHRFEWIRLDALQQTYLYPEFIKHRIFHLPDHLEFITEIHT